MSRTFDPAELNTGATVEQVEAACERRYAGSTFAARHPWKAMSRSLKNTTMALFVREAAQYLVPPGYVIAPVAEVISAEQRAAVRRALYFSLHACGVVGTYTPAGHFEEVDFVILHAIAEGGTE